jgi:hypothetical protein
LLLNNNLRYSEGRAPLLLQDIKANATIAVDIWVKDLCPESNLQEYPKEWQHSKYNRTARK